MRTDTITLVTQYKSGKQVLENTQDIFGQRKSLKRNEFYAAYGVGLRPTYIFEINPAEFKLADITVAGKTYHATHIRFNGDLYEIIRTYEVDRFNMEITVK